MNILVTGGAGFIGSNTAEELIKEGHSVVIVDNISSGYKKNIHPESKFYKVDIQSKKVENIIKKHNVDIVYHFAAQKDVGKSAKDPQYDAQENILGTLNILEACKKHNVRRIIFASSGGVYGETETIPTPEEFNCKPISPYGISKFACEKYLYYYQHVHGIQYSILRYSNVFGKRQDPNGEAGVIAIFIRNAQKGKTLKINGNGEQTRDFINIKDVTAANLRMLKEKGSNIYNVATGKERSVNEIVDKLSDITEKKLKVIYSKPKPGEQQRSCLDINRIKQKLEWKAEYSFYDGLKETWDWFIDTKNN